MSYFNSLLKNKNLERHNGVPLWKYSLKNVEYNKLRDQLNNSPYYAIDPRDVTLYYAEWWKNNYNGGSPSTKDVFNSLKGNLNFKISSNEFYVLAKKGAKMLGIKWICKQNTLCFRTLLLQGGLPLTHISENHGKYQEFLLAVLEVQPEAIEDFMYNLEIIRILPKSSQNETIYENCLVIVKSILNEDSEYDSLLESNESLKTITKSLKLRKKSLNKKERISKPQNYWLLNIKKGSIKLKLTFDSYFTKDSLSSILGFEIDEVEYQFYIDEQLICVFKRLMNGDYKTDWNNHYNNTWNNDQTLPYAYVIVNGKKIEVKDFIQIVPNFETPSLWINHSEDEWRLIKGNSTSTSEGALLFTKEWDSNQIVNEINISNKVLLWLQFDGEVTLNKNSENRIFYCDVKSYDWTITTNKPAWMTKSNMPVVINSAEINVFDEENKKVAHKDYDLYIRKHNSYESWVDFKKISFLPIGCMDLKIVKNGVIAYDVFFNIGDLRINYISQTLNRATVDVHKDFALNFNIKETEILKIQHQGSRYALSLDTKYSKVPLSIQCVIGHHNKKKLSFDLNAPFVGVSIVDDKGNIIEEETSMSLSNLYGLRILSKPNSETILRIKNKLKPDVIITKEINSALQPLISYKEDFTKLYYLSDAMDYTNSVCIELVDGTNKKTYNISGFSHVLCTDNQLEREVSLNEESTVLDLYAIPLNCNAKEISLISLLKEEEIYKIPETEITNQFIIISLNDEQQLMPRYVSTINIEGEMLDSSEQRIEKYHNQLVEASYDDEIWKQLVEYFKICIDSKIPFSTFDQLRAISKSSLLASKAFFFFGINQADTNLYIQKYVLELERDLGFCFFWIQKNDWQSSLFEMNQWLESKYFDNLVGFLSLYMNQNGLQDLCRFMTEEVKPNVNISKIDIRDFRAELGERVLKELPYRSPFITKNYGFCMEENARIRLLLQSPIAVAESILGIDTHSIWGGDEKREDVRRNIQYSQYLNPSFFNKMILNVLNK